jgi:hypothetical protein
MNEYVLSPTHGSVVAHSLTVADIDRAAEFRRLSVIIGSISSAVG